RGNARSRAGDVDGVGLGGGVQSEAGETAQVEDGRPIPSDPGSADAVGMPDWRLLIVQRYGIAGLPTAVNRQGAGKVAQSVGGVAHVDRIVATDSVDGNRLGGGQNVD